jgi:hypothetical protein
MSLFHSLLLYCRFTFLEAELRGQDNRRQPKAFERVSDPGVHNLLNFFFLGTEEKMENEQIQLLSEEPGNYSNPKEVYQLPFPSVNPIPRRFSPSDNKKISYMGRECFEEVWEKFLEVELEPDYRQAIYVYGGKGYGKSHVFAALACLLVRKGYPVIYIPDCRGMLRSPYILIAFLFAFIAFPSIYDVIREFNTLEALAKFCEEYQANGKLCFIIDQQNALDPEP